MILSIITPYYKVLKYTKELAKVLEPQLNDKVEWIIIDDGCNEEELDNIKAKIIHLEQNSGGASIPRNIGIKEAKGKYTTFIDADDLVSEDYIEKILKKCEEDFDYCYFSWRAIGVQNYKMIIKDKPPFWNCCVWDCIYKTSNIKKIEFDKNLKIAEDYKFNVDARKGKKANILDILYIHRMGVEGSLTVREREQKIMIDKFENIFYIHSFNAIGGVESWIYYLAKNHCKDNNILVVYGDEKSSNEQIKRLSKYVTVVKDNKNIKYRCKKVFYNYWQNILDRVEAEEYVYVCHADMKKCKEDLRMGFTPYAKTNKMISVSNLAKDSLKEAFGYDSVVCHNPVAIEETREPLLLISATRLTNEKGYENMQRLGRMLDDSNIPYVWLVFSNRIKDKPAKKMCFLDQELEISGYIKKADYLVQLSKWESDGLSVKEALKLGTKVIVSDIPAFHEAGVKNGENGYYFDANFNLNEVYDNRHKKISYEPPKDEWEKYLYKSEPIKDIRYKVKAIMNFTYGEKLDFEYKQTNDDKIKVNDIFYCSKEQYSYLSGNNIHKNVVVELIGVE